MRRRSATHLRPLAALAVVLSLLAACGGDDSSSDDTAPPETSAPADTSPPVTDAPADDTAAPTSAAPVTDAPSTEPPTTAPPATDSPSTAAPATDAPVTEAPLDPAAAASAYIEPGPYPVGVTTLERSGGQKVEIWYPAVEGTTGTETYDVRDFVPPAIKDLLTADVPATFSYAAGRDAEAADGPFPVVLFSHGFTGMRLQSTFLTSHLASYGMIVVSTDHPSRDMYNQLGGTSADAPQDATADLLESLDLVTAEGERAGSLLEGRVDAERVAAVGHSAGGGTVLAAATDPRVDGYVSLASGAFRADDDAEAPPMPDKPSFFMAGTNDQVVSPDERTRPAYEAAPSPSRLWIIDGVGHNGFDDFCSFGNGSGIIGVAEASGLGPLLDSQPQLRALGEDGCKEPNLPVQEVWPIIQHAVTAQLRYDFGVDPAPVGLGPEVEGAYDVAVEVAEK